MKLKYIFLIVPILFDYYESRNKIPVQKGINDSSNKQYSEIFKKQSFRGVL